MRSKHLALTLPAVLMLTACGGDGVGDSSALDGVDLHMTDDGVPEVLIKDPIETDEQSSQVLEAGDGDPVEPDQLIEYSQAVVDPASGEVQQETYSRDAPQLIYLPSLEQDNEFVFDSFTETGLTVGGDVALFMPAESQDGQQMGQQPSDSLTVLRVEAQMPDHAVGEEIEQSGDLPAVESVEGEAPTLPEAPGEDAEKPEETTSEVLIEGDGEEVGADDTVVVRYTGWKWSDGEVFDSAWPGVEVPSSDPSASASEEGSEDSSDDASEDDAEDEVVEPFARSLNQVVPGWKKGLEGQHIGDRVLIVVPPEDGYGDTEGSDLQEETLIFAVDVLASYAPPEGSPQGGQQGQGSQEGEGSGD